MELAKILELVTFTHKFQQVKRKILVSGESRPENDAEHSYQLAMLAWFLNDSEGLKLNSDLLIRYALVHDLVETYAGDIPISVYKNEIHDRTNKKQNEFEALKRIEREFGKFKEMINLMKRYETKEDAESKFIYSLDKLLPMLNVYLDDGRSWKEYQAEFEKLLDWKDKTINEKNVRNVYQKLKQALIEDKERLFGETDKKFNEQV